MGERFELEIRDARGAVERRVLHGGAPGQAVVVTVGRDPASSVVIDAPGVSARHAELRLQDGRVEVRDAASRFGTFVGDSRAAGWTSVDASSSVWLGDIELRVRPCSVPSVLEIRQGAQVLRVSLAGGAGDEVDSRVLSGGGIAGVHAPLRAIRDGGRVVALLDGRGVSHALPGEVAGVAISLVQDTDSLASVVAAPSQVAPSASVGEQAAASGHGGESAPASGSGPQLEARDGVASGLRHAAEESRVGGAARRDVLGTLLLVVAAVGMAAAAALLWSIR